MFKDVIKNLSVNNCSTQKDVADYLSISRVTYIRYESGDRQPDYDTLIKLANYFNVAVDYLLDNNSINTTKTSDKKQEDETNTLIIMG